MQELIRSMGLTAFLFVTAVLLVIAGAAIYGGLRARRRAAFIKATPTSNIGMAPDGYCEFEGTIEAISGPQVVAPLTHRPCAWYHAKLEKWDSGSRRRDSSYATIRESTSGAPILLRDASGVCLVLPYSAEVTPTEKSVWTGSTAVPTDRNPPHVGAGENAGPSVTVSGSASQRYRYSEERINVGDPLLVLGEFSRRQFESGLEDDDEEDDDVDGEALEGEGDDATGDSEGNKATDSNDANPDDAVNEADWDDSAGAEELTTRAEQVTRACIGYKHGSDRPFIMTTTPQATHIYMTDMGGQAALYVALVPLGVLALMLYARFN